MSGFVWVALADVLKGCGKHGHCFIGDGHRLMSILTSEQDKQVDEIKK